MTTHYGDSLFAIRRDEEAIAKAAIQAIRDDWSQGRTASDPFLNEPVCGMVSRVAQQYLNRPPKGDDDEEYYAKCTWIQERVLDFILQGIQEYGMKYR